MPVRKFRNIEEMKAPRWREPGDPELFRAMITLWAIGQRTRKWRFSPGVHKYSSVQEMHLAQERLAERRAAS
jgi:hypothetical protein